MTGNKAVTAHFTPNAVCYPLTITITPAGGGQVSTSGAKLPQQ